MKLEDKRMNREWERFGEDIRRTVQNAIDSQDFGRLNQTITNTINDAVDTISRNIRNAGSAYQKAEGGTKSVRSYSYDCRETGRETGQNIQEMKRQPGKKLPRLYRRVTAVKAGGTVMTALGMTTGGIFSLLLLFFGVGAFALGSAGAGQIMAMALFLILAVAGFVTGGFGSSIRGRAKRFQTYIQVVGHREYCNIQELSTAVKKNAKYVVRDLEDMFLRGWFLQGHLDERKTCLIVSDGMYRQYQQIEAERKESELLAAEWREKSRQAENEAKRQEDRPDERDGRSKLPPQVQKVIEEGDMYIRRIHACNDAVSGREISAKITRMEMLVDRIFDRVEQNPESVDDIRKLMEYY
ncbi:MAG: hypothetical protein K2O98_11245, partial [Lachnospiraceae bacterium]|nr:hypothetical protein [Lachnospiraceae bacterium]